MTDCNRCGSSSLSVISRTAHAEIHVGCDICGYETSLPLSRDDGWIGVDLDGTLAVYDFWRGETHIGEPIPPMVDRVRTWLLQGRDVRIFTARAAGGDGVISAINKWTTEHLGYALPVTNCKDYSMIELWDDRCVQVEKNTGRRLDGMGK